MNTDVIEKEYMGTCTFLCMLGDISLAWDEQNREVMLELIRKKMKEGYSFFTTKTYPHKKFTRKVKVTNKNIEDINEIILTDDQFNKMVEDMDDQDVTELVLADKVDILKRQGKSEIMTHRKADRAEDVIDKNSVAIRPIAGG